MEVLYEYNTAIMYIHQVDLQKYHIKTGDTEGLVNYLLTIKGIRFGAIVIDRTEERKWSFRSKGGFDVNQFARNHFEGGGHANASGGRSSDSVEKTVEHFKQRLYCLQVVINMKKHPLVLLTKLKTSTERLWYAAKAIEHGWSRAILMMQIETCLYQRQGATQNNFANRLPA
eukprot:gene36223-59282_t